jgi:hypothetical protein
MSTSPSLIAGESLRCDPCSSRTRRRPFAPGTRSALRAHLRGGRRLPDAVVAAPETAPGRPHDCPACERGCRCLE